MTPLSTLLSQRQPNLQTRSGLILINLQYDFISPHGKLPMRSGDNYIDKIREVVPVFRKYSTVLWVKSHYKTDRHVSEGTHGIGDSVIVRSLSTCTGGNVLSNGEEEKESPMPFTKAMATIDGPVRGFDDQDADISAELHADEELFLTNTAGRKACCIVGTTGAEFAAQIQGTIDTGDLQVLNTCYSAFRSTPLLPKLRSRFITHLFIGGNMTNISVFATAMDAARYGIKVTLLADCLGYRHEDRHETAIKTLQDVIGAEVKPAMQAIETLRKLLEDEPTDDGESKEGDFLVGEGATGVSEESVEAGDEEDD